MADSTSTGYQWLSLGLLSDVFLDSLPLFISTSPVKEAVECFRTLQVPFITYPLQSNSAITAVLKVGCAVQLSAVTLPRSCSVCQSVHIMGEYPSGCFLVCESACSWSMCVCLHVFTCVSVSACACMHACMYLCMHAGVCVCLLSAGTSACMSTYIWGPENNVSYHSSSWSFEIKYLTRTKHSSSRPQS